MKQVLDRKDWKILGELQKDGRISVTTLARKVGLSRASVTDRLEALRAAGVIQGLTVIVDLVKVGLPVSAYVRIRASTTRFKPLVRQLNEIPEVTELHVLSGAGPDAGESGGLQHGAPGAGSEADCLACGYGNLAHLFDA
jgi:Lrp/AsnC family leucine-responsive transcriptional regulator